MLSGSTWGAYANAATPMIRSQLFGSTRYNLFQFFSLSDGNASNTQVKISIASIRPDPLGGFGTFSVLVRDYNDTDAKISVLEQFDSLTLNPDDSNYVGKRIGTARPVIDSNGDVYLEGEFPNNSKYVYISIVSGISSVPSNALPYGFVPVASPLNMTNVPSPIYVTTRYYTPTGATTAINNDRVYYGWDFSQETNDSYVMPSPSGSINSAGSVLISGYGDSGFDLLTSVTGSDSVDVALSTNTLIRKYSVPLQGGFDGMNPAQVAYTGASIQGSNTMGFDLSDSSRDGAKGYALAIQELSNADYFDINLLIMPGVLYSLHPYVAQKGIDLCETRGDAFYIMDPDVLGADGDRGVVVGV
jgi:hypothetical protein